MSMQKIIQDMGYIDKPLDHNGIEKGTYPSRPTFMRKNEFKPPLDHNETDTHTEVSIEDNPLLYQNGTDIHPVVPVFSFIQETISNNGLPETAIYTQ
jgi:hypothetical protein